MEAQAVRDAVRLAQERHYPMVKIQTDAQEVIKLMEDPGGGRSEIASICQEIKELGGFFTRIKFSFVGRLANEAAHASAKMASSDRRRWLWINYTPAFLDAILQKRAVIRPLLHTCIQCPPRRASFRFESFWPRYPGFLHTVTTAWNERLAARNPIDRIRIKLQRTARQLRSWSRLHFSDIRLQFHIATEIVLRLDVAQDHRPLSPSEAALRKLLKPRIVGLAAVERARRRQASRITWLKEGDADTRFFHLKANARRRKNHIHTLQSDTTVHTTHDEKSELLHSHFSSILGSISERDATINWSAVRRPDVTLDSLDLPFTAAEIWEAIKDSPAEKAPGPDGFNGVFYRRCWTIIRTEIVAAFDHLYRLGGGDFASLNRAMVCLLPKKNQAVRVKDYRPISLIHSFAKLFSKVLARRLAPG
jgi:hypothetical protein